MAVKTKSELYNEFAAGMYPKDTDYQDLIDSCFNGDSTTLVYVTIGHNTSYNVDSESGRQYGDLIGSGQGTVMSSAQISQISGAPVGSQLIICNQKSEPFFLKVQTMGPGYGNSGSDPECSPATLVLAPNGSIMLVKTGSTYEGHVPCFSLVGVAVQGAVS